MPFRMRQTRTIPYYHVSNDVMHDCLLKTWREKKKNTWRIFSVLLIFSYDYVIRCIYFFLPVFIVYLRFYFGMCKRIDIIKILNDGWQISKRKIRISDSAMKIMSSIMDTFNLEISKKYIYIQERLIFDNQIWYRS